MAHDAYAGAGAAAAAAAAAHEQLARSMFTTAETIVRRRYGRSRHGGERTLVSDLNSAFC